MSSNANSKRFYSSPRLILIVFVLHSLYGFLHFLLKVFVTAFAVRGRYINHFYITLHWPTASRVSVLSIVPRFHVLQILLSNNNFFRTLYLLLSVSRVISQGSSSLLVFPVPSFLSFFIPIPQYMILGSKWPLYEVSVIKLLCRTLRLFVYLLICYFVGLLAVECWEFSYGVCRSHD